jgi:hypothetical protein
MRLRHFDCLIATITLFFCLCVNASSDFAAMAKHKGKLGFVVTNIRYAVAPDAAETGACPNGLSGNIASKFKEHPDWQKLPEETGEQFSRRIIGKSFALNTSPAGKNYCIFPELAPNDSSFPTVSKSDIDVEGIDLDQFPEAKIMTASCGHTDFDNGIDNQFYRVVGCIPSWQSTGLSNGFAISMLTGSWGILISLENVDDLINDDDVTIGIYSNADPIQLSAARKPLPYATYALDQDKRYRAIAKAQIRDGVLLSEPLNIRLHDEINTIRLDRVLESARLQLRINLDSGELSGVMAGYTSIDDAYDIKFGFRNGKNSRGEPANARLVMGSSNGAAAVNNYTCHGVYQSLLKHADAGFNPQTQRCEKISNQYFIEAIPAFVADIATESVNEALKKAENHNGA